MKVCNILRIGGKPHQLIECSAKLLFGLGLNRFPPLEEIIRMAAGPDEGLRNVALKYFFEKFTAQYASYDPSNEKYASIAFIPATRPNDEFLARPGEVWPSGTQCNPLLSTGSGVCGSRLRSPGIRSREV